MTIQIPNVGTGVPADQTGDSPWLAMKKVSENFSNTSHAASRLVGTGAGNVMEVGMFGLGGYENTTRQLNFGSAKGLIDNLLLNGSGFFRNLANTSLGRSYASGIFANTADTFFGIVGTYNDSEVIAFTGINTDTTNPKVMTLWHDKNATKDPNGFLKGASPIAEIYSDKMDLNQDATEQGGITFEKVAVGNYLVKGSLGFSQDGWYIETPKDANGNVLVAVVYEQLSNNDLSIKTYAKKFDDETGDIVANLLKPRDIPTGRFISLRLHEIPKPSPVMPTAPPTEV